MKKLNSLYIHFPFCLHKCNYCDFHSNILFKQNQVENFHRYLDQSLDSHKKLTREADQDWAPLETVYIGGGTPSLWGPNGAIFLQSFLKNFPTFGPDYEFTLEVNPKTPNKNLNSIWSEAGVNRYSVGIQSLNSNFLKILERTHTLDQACKTLDYFANQESNFSVDLMLGLPYSREYRRNIVKELEELLQFEPSHFSVYILTTNSDYKHIQHIPPDEWVAAEYLEVSDLLKDKGFIHYEVSNFAQARKESRHNLKYWQTSSVAAFGPSATGLIINDSFQATRYKWRADGIPIYDIERLDKGSLMLEKFYMALRTNLGINPGEFFSGNDIETFCNLAENWEQQGWCDHLSSNLVRLSPRGFLIIDSLMNDIFAKGLTFA